VWPGRSPRNFIAFRINALYVMAPENSCVAGAESSTPRRRRHNGRRARLERSWRSLSVLLQGVEDSAPATQE
jgi:hypothetical protein